MPATQQVNVRFGSKADMCGATRDVRFTPDSGHYLGARALHFVPATRFKKILGWGEGVGTQQSQSHDPRRDERQRAHRMLPRCFPTHVGR
jgi:hypothetical protein